MTEWKLITKMVLFLFLFVLINAVFFTIYHLSRQTDYLSATLQKHALLEDTVGPKIVIVGGSNAAFGIDSELIAANFEYPVVNMGLQGGLGCVYPLEEIKPFLHSGDIVVLTPEYHCVSEQPNLYGDVVLFNLMVVVPDNLRYITEWGQVQLLAQELVNHYPSVFLEVLPNLERIAYPPQDPFYTPDGFNQYGDAITHLGVETLAPEPAKFTIHCDGGDCLPMIERYNQFADEMAAQDVDVFYTFPPYLLEPDADTLPAAQRYADYLAQHLKMPILGTPQDYFYAPEYFFDTIYHLTEAGREIRTRQLIEELRYWFAD